MTTHIAKNRAILALPLVLPCAASIWLLTVRSTMSLSTFAGLAALLVASAAVGLTTWKNGQATGSVGQLLHETERAHGAD
jgi:hypothetical protein